MHLYEVKKNLSFKENFRAVLTILGLLRVPSCLAGHRTQMSSTPVYHTIGALDKLSPVICLHGSI